MDLHKLDVYRKSQDLLSEVIALTRHLPQGMEWLGDPARRSAESIPLNIAEGWSKHSPREHRRTCVIAIGSAHEAAACVEVMYRMDVLSRERFLALWDGYDHLTRMLARLGRT